MKDPQSKLVQESRIRRSLELYEKATVLIPKVTQLLSRHPDMHAFGVSPIYAEKAKGCRFWDVDGHEYIDTIGGTAGKGDSISGNGPLR